MIKTTSIGTKEDPYPMVDQIWDFFSSKGTKTVIVSVGTGATCAPELDLLETLGCPILALGTATDLLKWNEARDLLKTRKPSETTSDFAKPAARKWVLQKNLILQEGIPSYGEGTIQSEGGSIPMRSWSSVLKDHCKALGLPEEETRLDLLKVEAGPFQSLLLESLWQSQMRPSLLLVTWGSGPDSDVGDMLTAAHLQMIGYTLAAKEGKKFLYYFTDVNYYETCSWEETAKRFENPFVKQIASSIYPGSDGAAIQFPLSN
jgi:hypothetical protein